MTHSSPSSYPTLAFHVGRETLTAYSRQYVLKVKKCEALTHVLSHRWETLSNLNVVLILDYHRRHYGKQTYVLINIWYKLQKELLVCVIVKARLVQKQ
jgi:hypothetical protein